MNISSNPFETKKFEQEQWRFGQEQAMAPYQLGQAQLGLETGRFNLGQAQALAPYQLGQAQLAYQRGKEEFQEFQGARPLRMQQQALALGQAGMGLRMLPFQERTSKMQAEEYLGGAGLRGQQQELAGLQTSRDIGRTKFESQYDPSASDWFRERPEVTKLRQYQMGREAEELERLKIQKETQQAKSMLEFQPMMDRMRSGMMARMGGRLGIQMPSTQSQPSWMRSYQSPRFPRY